MRSRGIEVPMRYDARVAALALTVMLAAVPARSQTAALEAAKCRAGAQVIAKSIGGTVGNQTPALVTIMYAMRRKLPTSPIAAVP